MFMSQRPYCWHIMYPLNPGRLCEISAWVFSADMCAMFDDIRNGTLYIKNHNQRILNVSSSYKHHIVSLAGLMASMRNSIC